MKRLTYDKNGTEPKIYDCDFLDNSKCIQKLGQLEDIEDELGIDLVTLIKVLKGIYIKPNNIYVGSPYLCFAENENRELEFQFKVVDTWYKVKDYGKTWALTKEELERKGDK